MSHKSLLLLNTILFLSSTLFSKEVQPADTSTAFSPDTLRTRYPYLWHRTYESVNDTTDTSRAAARDSAVTRSIRKMTGNNSKRAREFDDILRWENEFIDHKPELDVARNSFVISPCLPTYFYLGPIDDPNPDLTPHERRVALKWQISVKMPLISAKYFNSGLFMAFTSRGTFDFMNSSFSYPVTRKTFMPEAFSRFDLAPLFRRLGVDQLVLQFGALHESNGGMKDSLSLFDSRGIGVKYYGQATCKLLRVNSDIKRRYLFNDRYAFTLKARGFGCYGVEDNPDIVDYIGYADLSGTFEFTSFFRNGLFEKDLGVWMLDGFFAPGGSIDPLYMSYALGICWTPPMFSTSTTWYHFLPKVPATIYFRFFRGYNEYLSTYNRRTTMWGFGFKLRG